MNHPEKLSHDLNHLYLRYIDSRFNLRYDSLQEERRSLLSGHERLHQSPYIEVLPEYATTQRNLAEDIRKLGISDEFVSFALQGLWDNDNILYTHQFEALRKTLVENRDFVVTTGTGSGKTECFLLPVFAELIRESKNWPEVNARQSERFWWRQTGRDWQPQRSHESRPAAMRALILYPLNALVEDQLIRLRRATDSLSAIKWLDQNRSGNRFYFGRYIGRTPIPGELGGQVDRLRKEMKQLDREQEKILAEISQGREELRYYFQHIEDGGEMWSRWDMQEHPPDILITNYSMLNIMMMRSVEAPIFDKTRDWLQNNPQNKFFLIVDELHSYRGTAGTEVAYLLRLLFDRIGLDPESDQLRIIASSASLAQDKSGDQFLREFFGRSPEHFHVAPGERISGDIRGLPTLQPFRLAFANFENSWNSDQASNSAIKELIKALDSSEKSHVAGINSTPASVLLAERLCELNVPEIIKQVFEPPKTIIEASQSIWGDDQTESTKATAGLLLALHQANLGRRTSKMPPLVSLRAHYFFRNLQGIWACCDPICDAVDDELRSPERPVGKLYNQPTLRCTCGSRVLDLLYCQVCGEIFLGGFRWKWANDTRELFVVPDQPALELVPDGIVQASEFGNYVIYWPSLDTPVKTEYEQQFEGERFIRRWRKAELSPDRGKIIVNPGQTATGWIYDVGGRNENRDKVPAFPSVCPACDADWRRSESSPIGNQRTGFQKINQVLADGMMRSIQDHASRKLVLFSDSRQDAAKLAAGMEVEHYNDIIRQLLYRQANRYFELAGAFLKQIDDQSLEENEKELMTEFSNLFQEEATALLMIKNGIGSDAHKDIERRLRKKVKHRVRRLVDFQREIELELLKRGINPGGSKPSLLEYEDDDRQRKHWKTLYNWQGTPSRQQSLSTAADGHLKLISQSLLKECAYAMFVHLRRSFESLRLGWVTFDPDVASSQDDQIWRQATDSVIRLLGEHRRYSGSDDLWQYDNMPAYARKYLEAVAALQNVDSDYFQQKVLQIMHQSHVLDDEFVLQTNNLFVSTNHQGVWQCDRCRRVHLHASAGICTFCYSPLPDPKAFEQIHEELDYYAFLASDAAGEPQRLHCEELTGQTDKDKARRRQLLFQNVFLKEDIPVVDQVDLLSVTTTMEAGVDIGLLNAVMMANMPPQRFNYQQRVGRAGRRGTAIAAAITFCRGRSHDDFYYQRPRKMLADPTATPYIDLRQEDIAQRVLNKEVLRLAFLNVGQNNRQRQDSVHGEFGTAAEWVNNRPLVAQWISQNLDQVRAIAKKLLIQANTELIKKEEKLVRFIRTELLVKIDDCANDDELRVMENLSERLANRGILPMFGFPTRVRYLFHAKPNSPWPWPPQEGYIDRDADIALSQFAPGAETVKDKEIHTAIGVALFRLQRQHVVIEDGFGNQREMMNCKNCQSLIIGTDHAKCPVCDCDNADQFKKILLKEALGYCTFLRPGRDYDSRVAFTTRAGRARLEATFPITLEKYDGLNLAGIADKQEVLTLNDNDGRLFSFQRVLNGQLQNAQIATNAISKKPSQVSRFARQLNLEAPSKLALFSPKTTDIVLLRFESWPQHIYADPLTVEGRAALYSFGFLLRKAAAAMLDIDESELSVGIRTTRAASKEKPEGQVFLADTLENGAGYCRYLGEQKNLNELLQFMLSDDFAHKFRQSDHALRCTGSCYECLRNYNNLHYHGLLDWRLAFELTELAVKKNPLLSVNEEDWERLASGLDKIFHHDDGWHIEDIHGTKAAIFEKERAGVFCHPLWQDSHPAVQAVRSALSITHDIPPHLCLMVSIFNLVRRPGWCEAQILGA